jgi:carboxyl-terminal processing protease
MIKKITFSLLVLLFSANLISQSNNKLYEIAKNIEIYTNVYKELNKNFVDEIDPGILMKTGIDAMTRSLDPYTRYFSESDAESFRISTEGKYSGIGSIMRNIDSTITVVEMYENSPSYKAGIRIGDQILEVNGKETKGKSSKDVANIVRGTPGTDIVFTVKSFGDNKNKKITIKRGEINIPNVPYFGKVNDSIGYIHLSTFTQNAGANVRKALSSLKDSFGIKGVILDLRNNGGGLLREAINVANVFVDKNEELVSTRGKLPDKNRTYSTRMDVLDDSIPLVVLINDRTASASEIVSGSIQDLDRGVIIGQRSFGKGLVQNIFPIGFNSKIKITISKYYIPSGRCIQSKIYENGKAVKINKDKQNLFHTRNGREVYDVGGVEPDIIIEKEAYSTFVNNIIKDNIVFKYVNNYVLNHPSIPPVDSFKFDQFDDFKHFLSDINYNYVTKSEKKLENIKKSIDEDDLDENIKKNIDALIEKIKNAKSGAVDKNKETIIRLVEKEIVKRYYFNKGKIKDSLKNDKEIEKAIEILSDKEKYNKILTPNK